MPCKHIVNTMIQPYSLRNASQEHLELAGESQLMQLDTSELEQDTQLCPVDRESSLERWSISDEFERDWTEPRTPCQRRTALPESTEKEWRGAAAAWSGRLDIHLVRIG